MNPHFNQNDEAYNNDDYYNNTYSLWQNSRFYDTNNLSPQNYNSNQWSTSKLVEEPVEVKKDAKNRRIITRMSLYEDPDLFYEKNYPQPGPSGFDWTMHNWKKGGEISLDGAGTSSNSEDQQPGSMEQYQWKNKIQVKLDAMMKQPVKLTKAESMMQKMGWQGGALGKSGSGIVEPIAPNAKYAMRTRGLGQNNVPRVKKTRSIDNNKNVFTTNVLLFILEFVKDDTEAEMLFDSCLWKEERKWIHCIVNDVINAEEMLEWDTVGHMDIVQQIYEYNCFVLATQSEGLAPNRQLCIFKEAPPNMYLITPADLKDEHYEPEDMETDTPTDKQTDNVKNTKANSVPAHKKTDKMKMDIEKVTNEQNKQTDVMEVESNPFLRSITRNLKNNEQNLTNKLQDCTLKEDPDIYMKIVEFFVEFAEQDNFTELRFLGPFDKSEICHIDKFFEDAKLCLDGKYDGVNEDLVAAFKSKSYDVHEDVNGFTVLYRIQSTT